MQCADHKQSQNLTVLSMKAIELSKYRLFSLMLLLRWSMSLSNCCWMPEVFRLNLSLRQSSWDLCLPMSEFRQMSTSLVRVMEFLECLSRMSNSSRYTNSDFTYDLLRTTTNS